MTMIDWGSNGGAHCQPLAALLVVLVGLGVCGCSRTAPKDWEVNGYQCTVTNYKFFTDKTVFADECPLHHDGRMVQVLAFVFPDGKVIIAPRDVQNLYEPQTHIEPKTIRYPTEAELKAWGAVKVTRQEISK
ncbi:MAG TPA: hypothetical protein VJT54_08880 [Verrucomicrobiae bacterium]|nr:hypothetical protein [Verrucomicrobiae bacterium]